VRSLLIVGQMRPDTLRHHQDETAIIHVQPVAATDQLVVSVARERAIGLAAKVRLIEAAHASP
jgi:hypothetical protein